MQKNYLYVLIYLVVAIFVISPTTVFATELWSEPTYTEQWSVPEPTEIWTETPAPNLAPASDNKAEKVYIRLQIGSKSALIQDKNMQLDVAPSVVDGRTMVPIRFIGEGLNASVGWDAITQKVTLNHKDNTIILIIGDYTALVNGKKVNLDVPALIEGGRTLVPLRFVSESLDLHVNYVAETKVIEIANQSFISNSVSTTTPIETTVNESATGIENLYGTWYIWTPGSATNLYDKTTGDYVTHEYNYGVDQGRVVINKDGTYSMTHGAWAKGIVAEGKWRLSNPSEINGERTQAIVLINGLTDVDWAVAPSDNGKIRLLYAMEWGNGSATWVFDSELYK